MAVFGSSTNPANAQVLKEIELAAGAFGVKLQYLDIRSPKDFETAFRAAVKGRAEAVLVLVTGLVLASHRTEIAELAVKSRLPAMSRARQKVEAGGLMSYGVSINDLYRRAATYVDKILKGSETGRPTRGATDEVRVHHQSESREADRLNDSAERAGESGQSDSIGRQEASDNKQQKEREN